MSNALIGYFDAKSTAFRRVPHYRNVIIKKNEEKKNIHCRFDYYAINYSSFDLNEKNKMHGGSQSLKERRNIFDLKKNTLSNYKYNERFFIK